jgi:hypothetical protein
MKYRGEKNKSRVINIHFFVVAMAIAAGVYVSFLDMGKYTSKVDILLIPKNEKIAYHLDKIEGNLITIFRSKNNNLNQVTLDKGKEDSILSIGVENYSKKYALAESKKISQEIIEISSRYYNIKKDLDLRIVNSHIERNESSKLFISLISIFIGLGLSFVAQLLVSFVEDLINIFIKKKEKSSDISRGIEGMLSKNRSKIEKLSYFPKADRDNNQEKKDDDVYSQKDSEEYDESLREDSQEEKEDRVVDSEEEVDYNFKKAPHPHDLPAEETNDNDEVNKESVPGNLPFEPINDDVKEGGYEKESEKDFSLGDKEPTDDEYRKRLNELLGNKYF